MAQENTHWDAVIAELEMKRDQLISLIESLKAMRGMGLPLVGGASMTLPSPHPHANSMPSISPDAFFGMTIPEATRKFLTMVKQAKPHPELCDALVRGGFKTNAANFRESVRATLARDPGFVKVNGQWGLSEWYGNRGKRKRRIKMGESEATGDGEQLTEEERMLLGDGKE